MKRAQQPALFRQVAASRLQLPTVSLRMVPGRTVEFLSVAMLYTRRQIFTAAREPEPSGQTRTCNASEGGFPPGAKSLAASSRCGVIDAQVGGFC